jgi:hypothetical protein
MTFSGARTITLDHVKFDDGIRWFLQSPAFSRESAAPLLLSFELRRPIVTRFFRIGPSELTELDGEAHGAFVAPLEFDAVTHDGHERAEAAAEPLESGALNAYSQVVAALVSTLSGSTAVAPPDVVRYPSRIRTPDLQRTIGIWHPVRFAGAGSVPRFFSDERADVLEQQLNVLCDHLGEFAAAGTDGPDKAERILQALRLSHLGHLNRRVDHELGKSLMIASLEACASLAIERNDPAIADKALDYSPEELRIKEFCEQQGGDVGGWFKMNVRDQAKLQQRFITYVSRYFPPSTWASRVDYPGKRTDELISSLGREPLPFRFWPDEALQIEQFKSDPAVALELLRLSYKQRSAFVHAGTPSPSNPNNIAWIVDVRERTSWRDGRLSTTTTSELTFELLSTAVREALLAWLADDRRHIPAAQ